MSKTLQANKYSGGSLHLSEVSEPSFKDQNDFSQFDFHQRRDMTPRGYSLNQPSLNSSRDFKNSRQDSKIYSQMMFGSSNQNSSFVSGKALNYSRKVSKREPSPKQKKILLRKASVSDPKSKRRKEREISCNLGYSKKKK